MEKEKQLKVSTLSSKKNLKISKINKYMALHPEGATPKMIALETGINVNTVKSILPKMANINCVTRGWYKVVNRGDSPLSETLPNSGPLHNWNFHNVVLAVQLSDYPTRSITSTHSFGLINFKFIISNKGNATIHTSTDFPLNISSICSVAAYFVELINRYSSDTIDFDSIKVRTIEFNKDYKNLRLDGVNCISLTNLMEQFKIYQKKYSLRLEHKTKINFNVGNIVDMLSQNPNQLELNVKLAQQKTQLDKLTHATSTNNMIISKLINMLKERTK